MLELIHELREWTMWIMEAGILIYVGLEYHYDKAKDDAKKQRKTRTTKKTVQTRDGGSTVEETTETSEPILEDKK